MHVCMHVCTDTCGAFKNSYVKVFQHSPAPELVRLGDVWVDHEGAAEGGREGAAAKVGQLGPFDGHDGLSGAIEILRLHTETG